MYFTTLTIVTQNLIRPCTTCYISYVIYHFQCYILFKLLLNGIVIDQSLLSNLNLIKINEFILYINILLFIII